MPRDRLPRIKPDRDLSPALPMRIGFITSDLSNQNGWATYSLQLIRALRARGLDATVVASRNSPDVEFAIHRLLPKVTPPERHTFFKSMRQVFAVRRLLRDCDIIHCTAEPLAILAAAVAGDRPLFITAHGSYVNLPRMRRFPVNVLYRRSFTRATLICVSNYTAGVARALLPEARVHVIPNGADVSGFAHPPAFQAEKSAPTVVAIGEIKPRKGTLELVEAVARVREEIPNVQCRIMGAPRFGSFYTTVVQAAIEAHGLGENVLIMGFVDEEVKRAWLAAADVLALPAMNDGLFFEGFGLTLYEAGACGTAVLGTDGCGVADAIEHGVTGLIVAQDNVDEELPRALLELLSNPRKAAMMGAAGRERALRQTWDRVAEQVMRLYDDAT
ncbi:MAG: glycosyltransferase family 4 protein [Chloroflexi bacterium]|nr:glycosyltransferase family 4 protein [Chloroflexota bacterium]